MKEHNQRIKTGFIFFIILSLGTNTFLIIFGDKHQVIQVVSLFPVHTIPFILGLTFLNYFFRFIKWHFFTTQVQNEVQFKENIVIWFSGLSMAATPGKLGELIKPYLLKKVYHLPVEKSIPIVFLERFTDAIGLVLLACFGMVKILGWIGTLLVIASFIGLGLIIMKNKKTHFLLLKLINAIPVLKRFKHAVEMFFNTSRDIFTLKNVVFGSAISVLSWTFEITAMWVAALFLNADINITGVAFALTASYLAGTISMLPGGVGVTEVSMIGILINLGVEKHISAILTIIMRICTLWFAVILGIIALLILARQKLIKNEGHLLGNVSDEVSVSEK